jgi:hypothetical protein
VFDNFIYDAIAMSLAAGFGLIGAIQLIGPEFVRAAYKRWDYSQRLRVLTGVLDIAAACMLAAPALRGWGIALAAILTFGSVIIFLSHRQYRYAAAAIGLMLALVPAAVAIPRQGPVQFIVQREIAAEISQTVAADTPTISTASIE